MNNQKEEKYIYLQELPFDHLALTDDVDDLAIFATLNFALSQESMRNIYKIILPSTGA